MPPKKAKEEITVVAQLRVTDGVGESLVVRSFDTAWHLAISPETPKPSRAEFLGFVRKD